MIKYDKVTKENIKYHNPKIADHPYRILIIGGSASGKTNVFLNVMKIQDDDDYSIIDKIYLYVKDANEPKHQYLLKKLEKMVFKI